MNIKLICSKEIKLLLKEILEFRGFKISEHAQLFLIEKGIPLPENGISIVFNPNEMEQLISLLKDLFPNKNNNPKVKDSLSDHLLGQIGESYELINYQEIILLETASGDIYARTNNGNDYQLKEKLYELEELLSNDGFIRINKSTIVNVLHINEIVPWFNGRMLLKLNNQKEVEVSRSYASDFKRFLGL